nr:HAD family hydrolase [Streptomyces himastatinicus]
MSVARLTAVPRVGGGYGAVAGRRGGTGLGVSAGSGDRRVRASAPCPVVPVAPGERLRFDGGPGVRGLVDDRRVEVLAPDDALPTELAEALAAAETAAHTPVVVRVDGVAQALIAVGDVLRPGSRRAVHRLRRLGVRPVLATGDRGSPAPLRNASLNALPTDGWR